MPTWFVKIISIFILIIGIESQACSCVPPGPIEPDFERTPWIFAARVLTQYEIPSEHGGILAAELEVLKTWKGEAQDRTRVLTMGNEAACGFSFRVGGEYLIWAHSDNNSMLWTNLCTRTGAMTNRAVKKDLAWLEGRNNWGHPTDPS